MNGLALIALASALAAVIGIVIGIIGTVAAFRSDIKVLTSRFDAWEMAYEAKSESDRRLLDERLRGIGGRLDDVMRRLDVTRRATDPNIRDEEDYR